MKQIILTTGPSFLHDGIIKENHESRYIYRINGSHGSIKDIEYSILEIRKQVPSAKILIDLPGNKIRTANLSEPIKLKADKPFFLSYEQASYQEFYKYLKVGDTILANDGIYTFAVQQIKDGFIKLLSHSDGTLTNNKGMIVKGRSPRLPFLLDKDKLIIKLANHYKVSYVGLSFVRTVTDVMIAKKLVKQSECICKIETREAVENLVDILSEVENILIDRGDLSSDVGLANIAFYQRYIIEKALLKNKKVFLATQFLKNMEREPIPTIAEVIDLTHTLRNGIHGIQLSEEMAIGKYPLKCLEFIHQIEDSINQKTL